LIWGEIMTLSNSAYGLILIGVIAKSYGLYYLAKKKDKPFEERKRIYHRFNWPANIMLAVGVIILATQWYL